jgi:hypothetical protein
MRVSDRPGYWSDECRGRRHAPATRPLQISGWLLEQRIVHNLARDAGTGHRLLPTSGVDGILCLLGLCGACHKERVCADHRTGLLTACQVMGQDGCSGCLGHGERSGACLPSGTYIACLIQRTICQRGEDPIAFWHVRRSLWTSTENYASNS